MEGNGSRPWIYWLGIIDLVDREFDISTSVLTEHTLVVRTQLQNNSKWQSSVDLSNDFRRTSRKDDTENGVWCQDRAWCFVYVYLDVD